MVVNKIGFKTSVRQRVCADGTNKAVQCNGRSMTIVMTIVNDYSNDYSP